MATLGVRINEADCLFVPKMARTYENFVLFTQKRMRLLPNVSRCVTTKKALLPFGWKTGQGASQFLYWGNNSKGHISLIEGS